MSPIREQFAANLDAEVLTTVRAIAESEGRELQALVDEALADLVEKRKSGRPRPAVMQAYLASHSQYAQLYKKLAE